VKLSEAKKKLQLGPIPHTAAAYEEFSPGAVAAIVLWKSAPMDQTQKQTQVSFIVRNSESI